jgi:hypothetical protein
MGVNPAYAQDMRDALDVFDQGAENLVAGWVKHWARLRRECPHKLLCDPLPGGVSARRQGEDS